MENLSLNPRSSEAPDFSSSVPPVKGEPSDSLDTIGDAIIIGPEKPSPSYVGTSYFDKEVEEIPFTTDDTRSYKVKNGVDYYGEYYQWEYSDGHNPHGANTKYYFDQLSGAFLRRKYQ